VNFVIILEALKFYKSRSARTIQVWFVLLYGINILPFILPFVDLNFDAYAQALGDLMKGSLPDGGLTQIMTRGNWIFLGLMVLTSLISSFFTLMYAVGVVSETDAEQPQHILRRSLASLPRLLLFGLLMDGCAGNLVILPRFHTADCFWRDDVFPAAEPGAGQADADRSDAAQF